MDPSRIAAYEPSIAAFRDWLDFTDTDAAKQWLRRMGSHDHAHLEGAIAEAVAWDYLACRMTPVRLGKSVDGSGPDFIFGEGAREFAVEVTNISIAAATAASGLPDVPDSGNRSGAFRGLTSVIKSEVDCKAKQLAASKRINVVFVTTLHFSASRACLADHFVAALLHAEPKIVWRVGKASGQPRSRPGALVDFEQGVFTKANSIRDARRHLSVVLLGGFGLAPPDACVRGVLHPNPARRFDPRWLPDIQLCRFAEWPPGEHVRIEWLNRQSRT